MENNNTGNQRQKLGSYVSIANNEDSDENNRRRSLRNYSAESSTNPSETNTNTNTSATTASKSSKKEKKIRHYLDVHDTRITLSRVGTNSNVFTKIAPANEGFAALPYSFVARTIPSARATRTPEQMGNVTSKKEKQPLAQQIISNLDMPSTSAAKPKRDKGWIKVMRKKKTPKVYEPRVSNEPVPEPQDIPIRFPEPRNKILYEELPIKTPEQVLPEMRLAPSRAKAKRDLRKKKAKTRKQNLKAIEENKTMNKKNGNKNQLDSGKNGEKAKKSSPDLVSEPKQNDKHYEKSKIKDDQDIEALTQKLVNNNGKPKETPATENLDKNAQSETEKTSKRQLKGKGLQRIPDKLAVDLPPSPINKPEDPKTKSNKDKYSKEKPNKDRDYIEEIREESPNSFTVVLRRNYRPTKMSRNEKAKWDDIKKAKQLDKINAMQSIEKEKPLETNKTTKPTEKPTEDDEEATTSKTKTKRNMKARKDKVSI